MRTKHPLATVMPYGPDDKTVTKLVVGIKLSEQSKETNFLRDWTGSDVATDAVVAKEMYDFMRQNGVKTVITASVVMGCPHEEGSDFPDGGDCPFCPFWKGRQGSASEDSRWDNLKYIRIEKLGFHYKFWMP